MGLLVSYVSYLRGDGSTMTMGIYGIHNTVSNKWYVGQSVNIERRQRVHTWSLRGEEKSPNNHLKAAWNKYASTEGVGNERSV